MPIRTIVSLVQMLNEIQSEEELEKEISNWKALQETINAKQSEIQSILDELKKMNDENSSRFKEVEKFMIRFNIKSKKVNNWIAEIKTELKYKVVRPDYKELWESAMTKVNEATKSVLQNLLNIQKDIKSKEVKNQLTIEGLGSIVKNLFNNIKNWILSINKFDKVTDNLPKVR